jgi:ComF family protein
MRTASSMVSIAVDLLASVVARSRCAACDARVAHLAAFCDACASTAERACESEEPSFAAFTYGGAVARAIARLKYDGRPDLARPLGDVLWRALEPRARQVRDAIVVPVPLHVSRLAERGFNQSALIARRLARHLGAPLLPLALARVRETPPQATLNREARIANVADAFRARQPERVERRVVLLVDDVRTTGATMEACTRVLMAAGAASVACAVVASVRAGDMIAPRA